MRYYNSNNFQMLCIITWYNIHVSDTEDNLNNDENEDDE